MTFSAGGKNALVDTGPEGCHLAIGNHLEKLSVKVLSHPGHGIQVQVESKATGLSVGS